VKKEYCSITCREVLDEFRDHLLFDPHFKKFQLSQQIVDEWINIILSFSEIASVTLSASSPQPIIPDKDDVPIVMAASCARTDYMVTWNGHLLRLVKSDGICFINPYIFVRILRPFRHFLYQLKIRIRSIAHF